MSLAKKGTLTAPTAPADLYSCGAVAQCRRLAGLLDTRPPRYPRRPHGRPALRIGFRTAPQTLVFGTLKTARAYPAESTDYRGTCGRVIGALSLRNGVALVLHSALRPSPEQSTYGPFLLSDLFGNVAFPAVLGAMAEFERELIREQVKADLRNTRAKGKKLGRPRKVVDHRKIARLRAEGLGWKKIAARLGVGRRDCTQGRSERPLGGSKNPCTFLNPCAPSLKFVGSNRPFAELPESR